MRASASRWGVVLLLASASGQCGPAGKTPPPNAAPPARVAVIDINKVLQEWKQAGNEQVQLEVLLREYQGRAGELKKELDALEQQARLLQGTDRTKKEAEAASKRNELESYKSIHTERLFKQRRDFFVRWYREIAQAAEATAREAGYDIVIVADAEPQLEGGDPMDAFQDFQRQVSLRKVLYARPEHDLTQRVLDRLNAAEKPK